MNKFLLIVIISLTGYIVYGLSAPASSPVQDTGFSKQQGDLILEELKSIRALLEKNQIQARQQQAPAAPQMVKVSTADGVADGREDAPLVLIEFTDYQCPYCKRFYDTTFAALKEKYIDTGKLRFISRNLPLPFHSHAEGAALAAACAGDQDKYWQMRQSIFSNPHSLQAEDLSAYAKTHALNVEQFDTCMSEKTHLKKIQKDVADARAIGITGTPSFVLARNSGDIVEGEKIIGAQPLAAFEKHIEVLLKQTK